MLKKIIIVTVGVLVLALVVGVFLYDMPAEFGVRWEPVTALEVDLGSEPVEVVADERVFDLFAAFNATGATPPDATPNADRQAVATVVDAANSTVVPTLAEGFSKREAGYFLNWMMTRGTPTEDFARAVHGWWVHDFARYAYGLDVAMTAFRDDAHLDTVWQIELPAYQAVVERWQPVMAAGVTAAADYLRPDERPRQIVVMPNLIGPSGSVYDETVDGRLYLVVGPTADDAAALALAQAGVVDALDGEAIRDAANDLPAATKTSILAGLPPGTTTVADAVEATLARAVAARLIADDATRGAMMTALPAAGYGFAQALYDGLGDYEASGTSFADYLPTLLTRLNAGG